MKLDMKLDMKFDVISKIEIMEKELSPDKKGFKEYLGCVKKLLAIAKNKNNDFRIVKYDEVISKLFEMVAILAKDEKNISGDFFSDNLLTLTLEALTEFLDMGLSELHQILQTKEELKPIISAEKTANYQKILTEIEEKLKPGIYREKNWRLVNFVQYGKALVKALGDRDLKGKCLPIVDALSQEKKDYGKALKGILNLLPEFMETYIVDIWEIKRMVISAKTNSKDTLELQKKIGEIRKDGILPLIYAAQEALIQVFMNTSGEQAEVIREMILGSESFHQMVHGSKSNFREQEKAFPTLFYFSGIKARSLENRMGRKASTVYRDGVEFWYRYIYGLAELKEFTEKNKDIISNEMSGEFNKILAHMHRSDGKPENYIIVLRQWLQEAMLHKEIDIEYLLCPSDENEKEKGEELEEKKGRIEIEIKEMDPSSSDKFLPVVNSVKISKNRFSMLAEKSGETLSKTGEIIMNTILSCGG